MNLQPIIKNNEEYRCSNCDIYFKYFDIYKDWKCPICRNNIYVKIEIDNYIHTCHRVSPKELKVGELVTLENNFIYEILDISMFGNIVKIALKNYRLIAVDFSSVITRIEGSWS